MRRKFKHQLPRSAVDFEGGASWYYIERGGLCVVRTDISKNGPLSWKHVERALKIRRSGKTSSSSTGAS
jgi:hypothetical protein